MDFAATDPLKNKLQEKLEI